MTFNLLSDILSIYLIDVVNGGVVFSIVHKRATEPVHIVHSENWVVYSYFNDKSRRTEVATLELYEGAIQSNTTGCTARILMCNSICPLSRPHQNTSWLVMIYEKEENIDFKNLNKTKTTESNPQRTNNLANTCYLQYESVFLNFNIHFHIG